MTVRVDAHHHVWDLTVRDQPWTAPFPPLRRSFTIDALRPHLAVNGIDATVLVQTVPVSAETPELLDQQVANPEIAGVVGWVPLQAPDVADRLAALTARPGRLVGIRHPVQDEPVDFLRRPEVRRGIRAVGAAGLVFDLLVTPPHLPAAVDLVHDLPDVRFVLDHGGKPAIATGGLEPWSTDVRRLAAASNTAAKLSGLLTEAGPRWTVAAVAPYADVLLDAFGPARTMMGSDWPVCLLAASYSDVVGAARELIAGGTTAEQADILGGTATRWYRLGPENRGLS